jgi:hypothetical protein
MPVSLVQEAVRAGVTAHRDYHSPAGPSRLTRSMHTPKGLSAVVYDVVTLANRGVDKIKELEPATSKPSTMAGPSSRPAPALPPRPPRLVCSTAPVSSSSHTSFPSPYSPVSSISSAVSSSSSPSHPTHATYRQPPPPRSSGYTYHHLPTHSHSHTTQIYLDVPTLREPVPPRRRNVSTGSRANANNGHAHAIGNGHGHAPRSSEPYAGLHLAPPPPPPGRPRSHSDSGERMRRSRPQRILAHFTSPSRHRPAPAYEDASGLVMPPLMDVEDDRNEEDRDPVPPYPGPPLTPL